MPKHIHLIFSCIALLLISVVTSCSRNTYLSKQAIERNDKEQSHHAQLSQGRVIEHTLNHDGKKRSYLLYIPNTHKPNKGSALVLSLHGRPGTSHALLKNQHWQTLANKEGFIVAFPQGSSALWNGQNLTHWNALNMNTGVDDVGFLKRVVHTVTKQYGTDTKRTYVVGFSNGGMMVSRLSCEAGDTFAAMASVAGIGSTAHSDCIPKQVTPIAFMHGEKDELPPKAGRNSNLRPVQETLNVYIDAYQCETKPETNILANTNLQDGTQTTHSIYSGCQNDATVEYFFIKGGGHTWPGSKAIARLGNTSQDYKASEVLWQFFSRHQLK